MRGIEHLVAAEIARRGLGDVVSIGHREVRFVTESPAAAGLATADDVFVLAAETDGIGGTRADLAGLERAVAVADLDGALAVRARCGGPPRSPVGGASVDVSASFLGRRTFNRYDVEDAVGAVLARRLNLTYHSRRGGVRPPAGGLTWRITIVDDRATVAVRLAQHPLHRRAWKVASVAGTLHPPLAAAMVAAVGVAPGERVLDPCCGAGTLAIEAAHVGAHALGVDLDPAAIGAAARNGHGSGAHWICADAGALPVPTGSVRRVLLNPPWGRKVRPAGLLAAGPGRLGTEIRRVLRPGGTAVLLVPDDGWTPLGFRVASRIPVALAGARLVVLVLC